MDIAQDDPRQQVIAATTAPSTGRMTKEATPAARLTTASVLVGRDQASVAAPLPGGGGGGAGAGSSRTVGTFLHGL